MWQKTPHTVYKSIAPRYRFCYHALPMQETPFHIQVIREALSKRQRSNPAYSLRAYSRDIGMDSSTLSQVLNGKRSIPAKNCEAVTKTLRLSPIQKLKFLESISKKRTLLDSISIAKREDQFLLNESHYRVIAEWEHYTALAFADLKDAVINIKTLSERLGITALRAESVVQNLLNCGLLRETKSGTYEKTHESLQTTEDVASPALREAHLEALELGKQKLESIDLELRDYSSICFAADPDQLPEIKMMIREFRKKVYALTKAGKKKREIYQLALQLYPLTKKKALGK